VEHFYPLWRSWGTCPTGINLRPVGTVETWPLGVFEVEFSEDRGRAYAMAAVRADQMMKLRYEPKGEAA